MPHSARRLHDWSQFDASFEDGSTVSILITPEKRRYDIRPNDALADRIVGHVENHFADHRSPESSIESLFAALDEAGSRTNRRFFAKSLRESLGTEAVLAPRAVLASPPSVVVTRGAVPKLVAKFANSQYLVVDVSPSGIRVESDPEIDTAARRIVSFVEACLREGLEIPEAFDALAEQARVSPGIAATADCAMEFLRDLPAARARFEASLAVPMVLPSTDVGKIRAVASVLIEELEKQGAVPTSGLVSRLMLLADSEHLRLYGRPVAFENYGVSPDGPVSDTISGIVPNRNARIRQADLGSVPDRDEHLSKSDFRVLRSFVETHLRTEGASTKDGCEANKAFAHAKAKGLDRLDYRLLALGTPDEILENVMLFADSRRQEESSGPRF